MAQYKKTRYRNVYKTANGKYCYRFVNEHGKRRERIGTTSLDTTEKLRRQAEDHATAIREGLIDVKQQQVDTQAREPIGQAINEYEQYLLALRATAERMSRVRKRQSKLSSLPVALSASLISIQPRRSAPRAISSTIL